jgi:hypothetical protein
MRHGRWPQLRRGGRRGLAHLDMADGNVYFNRLSGAGIGSFDFPPAARRIFPHPAPARVGRRGRIQLSASTGFPAIEAQRYFRRELVPFPCD